MYRYSQIFTLEGSTYDLKRNLRNGGLDYFKISKISAFWNFNIASRRE